MPSVCIFVFSDEISEIIISFRSDSSVSGRRFPVLIFILRLLQGAVFFGVLHFSAVKRNAMIPFSYSISIFRPKG